MSVIDWEIAEATGWTFEYIENLTMERLHQWLSIRDGRTNARKPMKKLKG